jgi:hypothetical protein
MTVLLDNTNTNLILYNTFVYRKSLYTFTFNNSIMGIFKENKKKYIKKTYKT